MTYTQQQIDDAMFYIGYSIKEGYAEPEDFVGMSEQEMVEWALYAQDRAENYADQLNETEVSTQ